MAIEALTTEKIVNWFRHFKTEDGMPLNVSEEDICPERNAPTCKSCHCVVSNPPAFLLSEYDGALLGAGGNAHAL
jgi:hypothetical protein